MQNVLKQNVLVYAIEFLAVATQQPPFLHESLTLPLCLCIQHSHGEALCSREWIRAECSCHWPTDNTNGPIMQYVHYSYPFIFLVIVQPLVLFSLLLVKTDLDQAIMKFISRSSESHMAKERRRNTYVQLSVNLPWSFLPHHASVFLFVILGYKTSSL